MKAGKHLSEVLHWVWSCRLQVKRYVESLQAEMTDHTVLDSVTSRRLFSQSTYDEHVLLLAARNLIRELSRSGKALPALRLPASTLRATKVLRDGYEHFHELSVRTRNDLLRFNASPRRAEFGADGVVIGGVFNITEFHKALVKLEAELLQFEKELNSDSVASSLDTPRPDA